MKILETLCVFMEEDTGVNNMTFWDVAKGGLWVGGKLLQGTAWVASEIVKDATGIDAYGTVKDMVEVSKSEKELNSDQIINRNVEGVEAKMEELARKRADLLRKGLPNYPDEKIREMDFTKLKSTREIEVYERELHRRHLERDDESDFQEYKYEIRQEEQERREMQRERRMAAQDMD